MASSAMESANNMRNPICLIENRVESGEAKLVVNPEAIKILSKIHKPAVVVSIVGMYRTGKSYLMNRLAGARKGFSLGSTIQSHTKGIWMWAVSHPSYKDRALILLDTEGLGDVEKGDRSNDKKIFTLAVLLSSAFVYNSIGTINQDALDNLKSIGEITEIIKVRTGDIGDNEGSISMHFPIFIWAIRDFILELDIHGVKISEDGYLENALKPKTSEESSKDKEYNELRNCLRMYFGQRKCFVFDTPTDSKKELKQLEDLPDERLEEEFVAQSKRFCDYIYTNAEVKRLDVTIPITGQRLGELAKLYTEVINSSKFAYFDEVVMSFAEKENTAAIQEATKHYKEKMKTITLPTETLNKFLKLSKQHENKAREMFLKRYIKVKDGQSHNKFMEDIKRMRTELSAKNDAMSREVCEALVQKLSAGFEKDLAGGTFFNPGGLGKFKQSLEDIERKYKMKKGKGVKAEEVLQEYRMSKNAAEINIIQQDNSRSLRQKEEEVSKAREEMMGMREKVQQLEDNQESQISTQDVEFLKNTIEQLNEKSEKDRTIMNEKLDQVLWEKERERTLYMEQGFADNAQRFTGQIEEIRRNTSGLFSRIGQALDRFFF